MIPFEYCISPVKTRTYAVGGWGGRVPFGRLPEIALFLVVVAGKAGNDHQKRRFIGGLAVPGTLWVNLPTRATV